MLTYDIVSGIRTPSPIAFLEKVCMLTRMLTDADGC
jgi:hypothetical protein